MEYPKEYPRMLGVAAVVRDVSGRILLHKRNKQPDLGKWELFGTYVKPRELVIDAVRRRLMEHASIASALSITFTGRYYDAPERNPNAWCIALAFDVVVDSAEVKNMAECQWVSEAEVASLDVIPHDLEVIVAKKS